MATDDKHITTTEEVIEAIAVAHEKESPSRNTFAVYRAKAMAEINQMVYKHLGFNFDEKSWWQIEPADISKALNVAAIKRAVEMGVEAGTLIRMDTKELRANGFQTYGQKSTGIYYTTTTIFKEAKAKALAEARNKKRYEFGEEAKQIVWDRYAVEVEAEYKRLCDESGLDPERESP